MEQNTKHAALATQVGKQVEKKEHTHDTDSQQQACCCEFGLPHAHSLTDKECA